VGLDPRKQHHNRESPQKSGSAEDNPIKKSIGKEHAEWEAFCAPAD